MTIFCLALDARQRAAFAPADHERAALLAALTASPHVDEAVLLATCNRVEFYLVGDAAAPDVVLAAPAAPADAGWTVLRDDEATRHLLRVACGLESAILGEAQILGQVTATYQQALLAGATGPLLSGLFQAAIRSGKRARSETAISRGQVSLASAALGLARRHVGDLRAARVAVVGAGQLATLAAHQAAKQGVAGLRILNRTPERAYALAQQVKGEAGGLDDLPAALAWADVLLCAAGGPQPLVTDKTLARAEAPNPSGLGPRANDGLDAIRPEGSWSDQPLTRVEVPNPSGLGPGANDCLDASGPEGFDAGRPRALVDLAMPAAVAITPGRWPHVAVFGLEQAQRIAGRAAAQRQAAVAEVEAIVAAEHDTWRRWLDGRSVAPEVIALRRKAQRLAEAEVSRTLRLLGDVDPGTAARIGELAQRLANKLLHEPTARVQASAAAPDGPAYAAALRYLFALPEEDARLV